MTHDSPPPLIPTGEATFLFGGPPPPALEYAVGNMIPEKHLSLIFAPGGTGKSLVGLYVALCIALGRPAFGQPTRQAKVLYIDYELDYEDQYWRAQRITRGLGISVDDPVWKRERPFVYYKPIHPLSTSAGRHEIQRAVSRYEPGFVVIDSVTIACGGADLNMASEVVPVMRFIASLGLTSLVVDHTAKALPGGAVGTPIGSVFKTNLARSVLQLVHRRDGVLSLVPTKANFGPLMPETRFRIDFGEAIRFVLEPSRLPVPPLSPHQLTLRGIRELYNATGQPVSQADVERWRRESDGHPTLALGTIRNHFNELKANGKIEQSGKAGEGYVPVHYKPPYLTDGSDTR